MRRLSVVRGLLVALFIGVVSPSLFAAAGTMARVITVIDGSTLRVEYRGGEHEVRLMGVATPPTGDDTKPVLKRLGTEAVTFLKEMTRSGWVYVEFPSGEAPQTKDGPVDVAMYGGMDSVLFNEKLVLEGFGIVNQRVATPLNDQLLRAEERQGPVSAGCGDRSRLGMRKR